MEVIKIKIGNVDIEAARCLICPGGMAIAPPEALVKHMERHAGGTKIEVRCRRCKVEFLITRPIAIAAMSKICPKCRAAQSQRGKRRKQMSSTGVSKRANIRRRG